MLFKVKLVCARHGMGYSQESIPCPAFKRRLFQIYLCIRIRTKVPDIWQRGMATPLDKPNGKIGCASKCLVNQLDPIDSQFFKYLWSQALPQSYRHYASGYYNGKSRISAIMQRHMLSHRLDVHKICHVESFFDISNVFPSASYQALDHAVYATARPTDAELLCQRHRGAVMHIVAHDSAVDVKCHAGAMQGDCPTGPLFLEVYHPQLDTWLRNTQRMPQ